MHLQELMRELQAELGTATREVKNVKTRIQSAKVQMKVKDPSPLKSVTKDCIMRTEPKFTVYKNERWREEKPIERKRHQGLEGDDKLPDNEDTLSQFSVSSAMDLVKKSRANVVFPKSERFPQKQAVDERNYNLQNMDAFKKRAAVAVIAPLSQGSKSKNMKGALQALSDSLTEAGVASSVYSDLETQASMSQAPGPGQYNPQYSQTEAKKGVLMPRAQRFVQQEPQEQSILNINDELVARRAPGVVMKKPNAQKTKQKLRREAADSELEEVRRLAALQNQKSETKKAGQQNSPLFHVPAPIMRSIRAAPTGSRERRFMLFALLDKVRALRAHGPAELDPKLPDKAPCMVKYRSVSPRERHGLFFDERPGPGPDYYYCKDDLTYLNKPTWTFAKEERIRVQRWDDIDRREALNPLYDLVLPRAQTVVINPEHEEHQHEEDVVRARLGPGAYDQSHKLVERRSDVGVPRFADLTEKNAREAQMDVLRGRELFDNEDLDPNMRAILPHIPGPVLAEATVVETAHPPDAVLLPERWEFYDWNVNAVREDQSKKAALLAGGKSREEFAEHEHFMEMMRAYFDRQRVQPEVAQYDPSYKLQQHRINVPDFKKYLIKDLIEPIEKPEGNVNGDNLILQPEKLKPHFQNIQIKKYSARKEVREENKEELIVDPKLDIVRPRLVKGLVEIKRMQKRPEHEEERKKMQEKDVQVDVAVNYAQIEPKVHGYVALAKQAKRPEGPKKVEQEVDVQIKEDHVAPRVTGGKFG